MLVVTVMVVTLLMLLVTVVVGVAYFRRRTRRRWRVTWCWPSCRRSLTSLRTRRWRPTISGLTSVDSCHTRRSSSVASPCQYHTHTHTLYSLATSRTRCVSLASTALDNHNLFPVRRKSGGFAFLFVALMLEWDLGKGHPSVCLSVCPTMPQACILWRQTRIESAVFTVRTLVFLVPTFIQ